MANHVSRDGANCQSKHRPRESGRHTRVPKSRASNREADRVESEFVLYAASIRGQETRCCADNHETVFVTFHIGCRTLPNLLRLARRGIHRVCANQRPIPVAFLVCRPNTIDISMRLIEGTMTDLSRGRLFARRNRPLIGGSGSGCRSFSRQVFY